MATRHSWQNNYFIHAHIRLTISETIHAHKRLTISETIHAHIRLTISETIHAHIRLTISETIHAHIRLTISETIHAHIRLTISETIHAHIRLTISETIHAHIRLTISETTWYFHGTIITQKTLMFNHSMNQLSLPVMTSITCADKIVISLHQISPVQAIVSEFPMFKVNLFSSENYGSRFIILWWLKRNTPSSTHVCPQGNFKRLAE